MRRVILAVLFFCGVLSSVASAAQSVKPPQFVDFGEIYAPPDHVSQWIGIIWVGPMSVPIVPAYYSPEHRKAPDGVLSRSTYFNPWEYRALRSFIHSTSCSGTKPRYPTILIQEYSNRSVRDVCFLQKDGCEYLFGIAGLPGVDWSHKDTYPLYQLEAVLGCKEPLTKWHDADGRAR